VSVACGLWRRIGHAQNESVSLLLTDAYVGCHTYCRSRGIKGMLIALSSLQYTPPPHHPTHPDPDSYYTHAHLLVSTCTPVHALVQPCVQTRTTFVVPVVPLNVQPLRRPVVTVQICSARIPVVCGTSFLLVPTGTPPLCWLSNAPKRRPLSWSRSSR